MKPDGPRWDSYYKTIDALCPLFQNEKIGKVIHGFYLNVAGDNFNSVRISYFVDRKKSKIAVGIFREFFRNNGIHEIREFVTPHKLAIAQAYARARTLTV
jgi:hypothetical protein